jgi:translation initiation factor 1A
MPNFKGGKHYKKKAKTDEGGAAALMIERQADQQVARVTKVLGNRNMQCYCNDNKVRICRVRGKLRNRVYIEQGDVVLISLRTLDDGSDSDEAAASVAAKPDRGDILAKYPLETHSKLKKEDGVNPKIFMQIEAMEGGKVAALGTAEVAEDFEFDRDGVEAEEKKADSEELDDSDIAAI